MDGPAVDNQEHAHDHSRPPERPPDREREPASRSRRPAAAPCDRTARLQGFQQLWRNRHRSRHGRRELRRSTILLTALAGFGVGVLLAAAGSARAQTREPATEPVIPSPSEAPAADAPACPVGGDSLTLAGDGLTRSRAAAAAGRLTILAIGSSSIEGVGASKVELGFVPLLQLDLQQRLPGVDITVINRGRGGETAWETANRLQAELDAYRPDLVIWQLGTNDILRARPWSAIVQDLHRGSDILGRAGVDVLLVDPQRLPEDEQNVNFGRMNAPLGETARLIAVEGSRIGYAVQRRFEAMRGWDRLTRGGVGPDGLHLNDEGYACWAAVTAESLAQALR